MLFLLPKHEVGRDPVGIFLRAEGRGWENLQATLIIWVVFVLAWHDTHNAKYRNHLHRACVYIWVTFYTTTVKVKHGGWDKFANQKCKKTSIVRCHMSRSTNTRRGLKTGLFEADTCIILNHFQCQVYAEATDGMTALYKQNATPVKHIHQSCKKKPANVGPHGAG